VGIPALRRKIPKRGPQQVAGRKSRSLAVPAPPCHYEKAAARKAAEAELLLNLFPNRGEQALPDCSFFPFFFFWPLLRLIAFHFRYLIVKNDSEQPCGTRSWMYQRLILPEGKNIVCSSMRSVSMADRGP
jgi:hypothetical protein